MYTFFDARNTFSDSEEDDVTAATMQSKEAETALIPFFQFGSLKEQLNVIGTEYSFICLLTEAGALDELKHVSCELRIFIKAYECLSEVVTTADQNLIIIVSQSLSRHFIPLIHDLIQVIYIYILYEYDSYYENGDNNYVHDKRYPKVRGSFIEQAMLISRLNDDLKQLSNIPLRQPVLTDSSQTNTNVDFYVISKQHSSLKSLTGKEQDFVSFQLIIKTILECDSANPLNNLTAALKLCGFFPNKNKEKFLWEANDEFHQKYVSKKAINFYLTDTSLKNELNTCFHSKNIPRICKLWFFIRDLLKQLAGGKEPITVYRGQYITANDLQILKSHVGSFMTFTKFFSMSTSNSHAMCRSGEGRFRPQLESVVFQLNTGNGSTSTRFTMLKHSYEEQTFLFAAGSVFRIESIKKLNDQVWYCKLHINSDDESEQIRTFQHYEMEIGKSLTYLSLGVYLSEIGKEDLAVQYYDTLLLVVTDKNATSSIHNNLAIIYERKKDLLSARYHRDRAMKTKESDISKISTLLLEQTSDVVMAEPESDTSPIINYYNLACAYRLMGRFDEAVGECEKALYSTATAANSASVALVYSAMGSVYFCQKKYEDALKSFQMALDIALIHLQAADPLIDQYLNNVRLLKNKINEK